MAKKQLRVAKNIQKVAKKKAPKKRKTTRYEAKSLVGLDKKYFSKVKQEFHDIDYADQLSPKDKKFMSTFLQESLGANLNHPGKKLHKSKKSRKTVFDANNARQRDIYSNMMATGRFVDIDTANIEIEEMQSSVYVEDADCPELTKQEDEILTKREFKQLLRNGAILPDSLVLFYKKLYNLE